MPSGRLRRPPPVAELAAAIVAISVIGFVWGPATMLLAEYADFPEWLRRTVFVFGVPWVRIAFELWVVKRVLRVTWRGALAHTGLSVFDRRQLGLALLVSVPVLVAALLPRWADHAEFAPVPTLIGRFAYLFLAVGLGEELAYRSSGPGGGSCPRPCCLACCLPSRTSSGLRRGYRGPSRTPASMGWRMPPFRSSCPFRSPSCTNAVAGHCGG
jgi:hypothetical protein